MTKAEPHKSESDASEPSSFLSIFKLDESVIALIIVNFLPVVGGLFFGWDIRSVLLVYWAENLVIGFYNVLKMSKARSMGGASKFFLIPFFMVHFGGFCAVHGVFVLVFLSGGIFGQTTGAEFNPLDGAFDWPGPLAFFGVFFNVIAFIWNSYGFSFLIPVLGLFVSHGISFKQNFIDKKEYEKATLELQMFKPYGRIVIMHVSIIFAAVPVFLLGSPLPLLILLVILKTIVDVFFHTTSHRPGGLGSIFSSFSTGSQLMDALMAKNNENEPEE